MTVLLQVPTIAEESSISLVFSCIICRVRTITDEFNELRSQMKESLELVLCVWNVGRKKDKRGREREVSDNGLTEQLIFNEDFE